MHITERKCVKIYCFEPPDTLVEFRANINILSSKSYCIPLAKINLVCNKNNNYTTSTKYFGRNKFKDALFTHDLIFREPNNHTTISICMDIHTERYTDAKTNVYSEREDSISNLSTNGSFEVIKQYNTNDSSK